MEIGEGGMTITGRIGCKHNIHRVIIFPPPYGGNILTCQDEDFIIFRCPYGCEDIELMVTSKERLSHELPKMQEENE